MALVPFLICSGPAFSDPVPSALTSLPVTTVAWSPIVLSPLSELAMGTFSWTLLSVFTSKSLGGSSLFVRFSAFTALTSKFSVAALLVASFAI